MKEALPNAVTSVLDTPDLNKFEPGHASTHRSHILLLYGSRHETSYIRLLDMER